MVATPRTRSSKRLRRRVLFLAALLGLSAGLLSAPAQRAEATSITVNTELDPQPDANGFWPNNDGKCSLRAAIESAATNSNIHDTECAVGLPGELDTIHIDASLAGRTLTMYASPFATIMGPDNRMEIVGPTTSSGGFTIDANNATRVFELGYPSTASAGANLRLANLTVKRGNGQGRGVLPGDGGAVVMWDGSQLTLDNVVMRDNHVTGSARGGAIYAVASTITNNGGAYINNHADGDAAALKGRGGAVFMVEGPSELRGYAVLFENNRANYAGGAVATNPGTSRPLFHLERSLVKDNSATVGGVMFSDSTWPGRVLELQDSTITGNSATQGGGVFFAQATSQSYQFLRDTFRNNSGGTIGGGLFSAGAGFTANSIIVDSGCKNTTNIANHTGTRNLFGGDTTGCNTTYMGTVGEITGLAGSLAQNGGPEVQQTYALLAGSNAIDNGSAEYCGTVDARSVPRGVDGNGIPDNPQPGDCDIGAYEYVDYIVNFETGTSTVAEGDNSTVWLELRIMNTTLSPLTAPLTVNFALDPASTARLYADYNIPGYTFTFPAGSVNGARASIGVNASRDYIAEAGGEFVTLNLTGSPTSGVVIAEPRQHTVSIQDSDRAGTITDDGGNGTLVSEANTALTDSFTVRLSSRPDFDSQGNPSDVVMHVEPDRDCEVTLGGTTARLGSPVSVTIANADWQTAVQTLTVRGLEDLYDEDLRDETVTHPCRVTITFTSADPVYNQTTADYIVDVVDNDVAGVTVSPVSPTLVEGDATSTATYTVVLNTPPDPGDPVPYQHPTAVVADPDTQCTLDLNPGDTDRPTAGAPVTLPFTQTDWNVPKVVTVAPFDDNTVELGHQCAIVHTITGDDPVYANLDEPTSLVPGASALIQDYDPPAITNDPPYVRIYTDDGVRVDEATPGVPDTMSVVLLRRPLADVDVKFSSSVDPRIPGPQLSWPNPGHPEAPLSEVQLTFTPDNWDTLQTVPVYAVDDDYDEGTFHHASLRAEISSTAAGFSAETLRKVVVDGLENLDFADIRVTVDDDDISAIIPGGDAFSVAVAEGGAGDSYTFTLGSHPYADVDITIDPDDECTVNNGSPNASAVVPVAASAWNTPVTITVAAAGDSLVEGDHQCTITHAALSAGDPLYNLSSGALAPPVTVAVADDDPPRVLITTSSALSVDEANPAAVDTYSVVLASQPDAGVTVTATTDGQVTVRHSPGLPASTTSLTFTPTDWLFPQSIEVASVDDPVDEDSLHTGTITHAVTSTATGFAAAPEIWVDGTAASTVTVSVADNDTAAVTISESGGSTAVTEGGATDTYTVVLATRPTAGVAVTASPGPDCTAIPASVAFTTDNWSTAQAVTVSAVDDPRLDGPHNCTVTHSATSADPKYDGITIAGVTAAVTDNDHADVALSGVGALLSVSEATPGTADTFTAVLRAEPGSDVTVTFTASAANPQVLLDDPATAEGPATAVSLTFSPADWAVPKVVEVFAVDDPDIEASPHTTPVTATMASSAPGYSDPAQRRFVVNDGTTSANTVAFAVYVTDNDVAGIASSTFTVFVAEGDAGVPYFLSLTSRPSSPVTVTVDPGDECAVNGGSAGDPVDVLFTRDGWNVAATGTVTVAAVDDAVAEAAETCPITHTAASADTHYQGLAGPTVTVDVTDNDPAGVAIVTGGGVQLSEADLVASGTYTVVLTAAPDADVTVHVTVSDGQTRVSAGAGPPATAVDLVFTPANWNVVQTVTVTAVDDDTDEADPHSGTVRHSLTSEATGYSGGAALTVDGLPGSDVVAPIADDDTAGLTLTEALEGTAVAEGGASGTYTAVLDSAPTAAVEIAVSGGADCTATPGTLLFDAGNWSSPQTVIVTALDDLTVEGPETCAIAHVAASSDPNYSIMAWVVATVTDNDTAGVTITTSDTVLSEADAADTGSYAVVLDAQPLSDVTVTASVTDGQTSLGGGGAGSLDLVFTPGNWSTPQTVTVHAVDDDVRDPDAAVVHHSVGSTAYGYASSPAIRVDGAAGSDVLLTVADNDAPVASDDAYAVNEDTALVVPAATGVLFNDRGGVTAAVVGNPGNGTLSLNPDGSFVYTPALNYNGTDSFTYQAFDRGMASNTATVTITVTAVDDAPIASDDAYAVNEDAILDVAGASGVLGNDADVEGDSFEAVLVSGPANAASFTLDAAGSFRYTPVPDFNGPDSFTYYASGGGLASNVATVTITVNPVNDPPDFPTGLGQFASDGTAIPVGGDTSSQTVIFRGTVTDRDGDDVVLVIEAKPVGTVWSATGHNPSPAVPSGNVAQVKATNMSWGAYHWRAWAEDAGGLISQAVSWGAGNLETESDFEVHATTTLLYNGDQLVYLGDPLKAAAKLSSPATSACVAGQPISFETDDDPLTVAIEDGHYPLGSNATTISGGQATISGISTTGWQAGVYTIRAIFAGTPSCDPSSDEATLTIPNPGDSATGGGWYTLSGIGRVNLGFTVHRVAGTDPPQYKGQALLINNGKWRLKGALDRYGQIGTAGGASGAGNLYAWDATLNDGLGGWVLTATDVPFTISFADNGTGGRKAAADTFGIHIDYASDPSAPPLPNSAPQPLKGGNIRVGPVQTTPPDGSKPGGGKRK